MSIPHRAFLPGDWFCYHALKLYPAGPVKSSLISMSPSHRGKVSTNVPVKYRRLRDMLAVGYYCAEASIITQ